MKYEDMTDLDMAWELFKIRYAEQKGYDTIQLAELCLEQAAMVSYAFCKYGEKEE